MAGVRAVLFSAMVILKATFEIFQQRLRVQWFPYLLVLQVQFQK